MGDSSEILAAIKDLQNHLEVQIHATNKTLQEFVQSVDSRFTELKIQQNLSESSGYTNFGYETANSMGEAEISPILRSLRMDVPKFDGTDAHGWIFRVEEFFDFHGTSDHMRLRIVPFHMEGRAATWFQWMMVNNLLATWPEFITRLKSRFGSSPYNDPQGILSKRRQTSIVTDFQSEFEDLMNRARLDEAKADIKLGSRWSLRGSGPPSSSTGGSNTSAHSLSSPRPQANGSIQVPLLQSPTPVLHVKRLPFVEIKDRHERGLCYNCDENSSPSHRCKDGREEEPVGDSSSLHSLASGGKAKSLKLTGRVGPVDSQVLIDSGSTPNSIIPYVAEKLKLSTKEIQPFRVIVGNGDYLNCKLLCPWVSLMLQGNGNVFCGVARRLVIFSLYALEEVYKDL